MAFKIYNAISQVQSLISGLANETDPDESARPGSGKRTTSTTELKDFHSINIVSNTKVKVKVYVAVEDRSNLEIEIDDNLQSVLAVDVLNKCLTVKNIEKYRSAGGLIINIKTKSLDNIMLRGDVSMIVKNVKTSIFSVHADGLSEINVHGHASISKIELNGSVSQLNFANFLAHEVDLKINGSANATLNVTRRLNVTINGTGNVRYKGNPTDVRKEIRGLGMVVPEEI